MSRREKLVLNFLIWLCVFLVVLITNYAFRWLGIDWPLWGKIAVSTAMTVPFIGFIASPWVERLIAAAEGRSRAELKVDEAGAAEGPAPGRVARDEE